MLHLDDDEAVDAALGRPPVVGALRAGFAKGTESLLHPRYS